MNNFFYYVLILIFVIIIISAVVTLFILQPNLKSPKYKNPIGGDYFDSKKTWSKGEPKPISVSTSGLLLSSSSTDKCNVYTYENSFDINLTPQINTLFDDYLNGYAHSDLTPTCLDKDQIMGYNSQHTCPGGEEYCVTIAGNFGVSGTVENYPVNCNTLESNDQIIPPCQGFFGSASFNFSFGNFIADGDVFDLVNSQVRCMSVQQLLVTKATYDGIGNIPSFYKNNDLIKSVDQSGNYKHYKDGIFYPIFRNDVCDTFDFKQKLRFSRYKWFDPKKGSFVGTGAPSAKYIADENGYFCEIVFRPFNLYLTYVENSNNKGIDPQHKDYIPEIVFKQTSDNSPNPQWLLIPSLNLDPRGIPSLQRWNFSKTCSNKADRTLYHDQPGTVSSPAGDSNAVLQRSCIHNYPALLKPSGGVEVIDSLDGSMSSSSGGTPLFTCKPAKLGTGKGRYLPSSATTGVVSVGVNSPSGSDISLEKLYKYKFIHGKNPDPNSTFNVTFKGVDHAKGDRAKRRGGEDAYMTLNPSPYHDAPTPDAFGIIKDGGAWWERKCALADVITFTNEYFLNIKSTDTFPLQNPQVKNKKPTPISVTIKSTSKVQYIEGIKNSVTGFNFQYATYDYKTLSKKYIKSTLPQEFNCKFLHQNIKEIEADHENDSACAFTLQLQSDKADDNPVIVNMWVTDPGKDNKAGFPKNTKDTSHITLEIMSGSDGASGYSVLTVSGIQVNYQSEPILYEALPMTKEGIPFENSNNFSNIKSSGAVFNPPTIKNGKFSNIGVGYGGYGYNIGDIVYIIEKKGDGSVISTYTDYKDLAHFTVTNAMLNKKSQDQMANSNLLNTKVSSDNVPSASTFYNSTTDASLYNFFIPSINEGKTTQNFSVSPQQVAFIGEDSDSGDAGKGLLDAAKANLKQNKPSELEKLFHLKSTPCSSAHTIVDFVKTIQFQSQNYQFDQSVGVSLINTEQPILGRFIPYRKFNTNSDDSTSGPFINTNNFQLINYGIQHLYEGAINSTNLPSI